MAALLTLAQAKAHLGIADADTSRDDELAETVAAAIAHVEVECGPVDEREVTEHVRGGRAVRLRTSPVLAVTALALAGPDGTAIDLTPTFFDADAGIVYGTATSASRLYEVTYTAGRAEAPADLVEAAKEIVRHLWATQVNPGPARPQFGATDEESRTPRGFAIPHRATELMAPHRRPAA